jgi:hypothetical protein
MAVQVCRQHFPKLLALLLINALPWAAIDWYLLAWILNDRQLFQESAIAFYWFMMLLVVSQAQVGTTAVTYYLGQSMFIEQPTLIQTIRDTIAKTPIYWWVHGGLRLVFPILGLAALSWNYGEESLVATSVFATMATSCAVLIRAFRPYVTEILLLERTPVRVDGTLRINFSRRSSNLHHAQGDLFGRLILGLFFLPLIFGAIFAALNLLDDAVAMQSSLEFPLRSIYFTAALWLTAGFGAVVRFLSYIDLRIRQEGWATELKMRAEGIKLSGSESL